MSAPDDIREQKRIGGIMQVLAWIVLLALGVFYFGAVLEERINPNQSVDTQLGANGQREVVLQRNRYGHYVVNGQINNAEVTFFLDTGATGVAIPDAVAQRLGLRRGAPFIAQTANGRATSYAVTLDRVSVGDIALEDVAASITPGLEGEEILLGMSFLRHIEFAQRGNQLILRQ